MEIILGLIILGMVAYAVISIIEQCSSGHKGTKIKATKEDQMSQRALQKEEYRAQVADLIEKFGKCTEDINLGDWSDYTLKRRLLIFEETKTIIINDSAYNFADIIGYSMVDDSIKETKTLSDGKVNTSTGSMAGRAVVGGIVGGGLGAVAGAATAKKNVSSNSVSQTETKHRYVIYINLDSIAESTIKLPVINSSDKAHKIANILNVIIERNKRYA